MEVIINVTSIFLNACKFVIIEFQAFCLQHIAHIHEYACNIMCIHSFIGLYQVTL